MVKRPARARQVLRRSLKDVMQPLEDVETDLAALLCRRVSRQSHIRPDPLGAEPALPTPDRLPGGRTPGASSAIGRRTSADVSHLARVRDRGFVVREQGGDLGNRRRQAAAGAPKKSRLPERRWPASPSQASRSILNRIAPSPQGADLKQTFFGAAPAFFGAALGDPPLSRPTPARGRPDMPPAAAPPPRAPAGPAARPAARPPPAPPA